MKLKSYPRISVTVLLQPTVCVRENTHGVVGQKNSSKGPPGQAHRTERVLLNHSSGYQRQSWKKSSITPMFFGYQEELATSSLALPISIRDVRYKVNSLKERELLYT